MKLNRSSFSISAIIWGRVPILPAFPRFESDWRILNSDGHIVPPFQKHWYDWIEIEPGGPLVSICDPLRTCRGVSNRCRFYDIVLTTSVSLQWMAVNSFFLFLLSWLLLLLRLWWLLQWLFALYVFCLGIGAELNCSITRLINAGSFESDETAPATAEPQLVPISTLNVFWWQLSSRMERFHQSKLMVEIGLEITGGGGVLRIYSFWCGYGGGVNINSALHRSWKNLKDPERSWKMLRATSSRYRRPIDICWFLPIQPLWTDAAAFINWFIHRNVIADVKKEIESGGRKRGGCSFPFSCETFTQHQ